MLILLYFQEKAKLLAAAEQQRKQMAYAARLKLPNKPFPLNDQPSTSAAAYGNKRSSGKAADEPSEVKKVSVIVNKIVSQQFS
jgi:hypothetical protein